eukprot:309778-Pleurochrysis_carterae.AAC.2
MAACERVHDGSVRARVHFCACAQASRRKTDERKQRLGHQDNDGSAPGQCPTLSSSRYAAMLRGASVV